MSTDTEQKKISVTARINAATHERLREAMEKSGWDQSDILRHALEIGLAEMALIDFRLNDALRNAILAAKANAKIPLDQKDTLTALPNPPRSEKRKTR